MKQFPRDPQTPVITKKMIIKILQGATIMFTGTLFIFFNSLIPDATEQHHATTIAFTTFVMFQMFNALNCRSASHSVFSIGLTSNKYFLFSIGASILMQLFVIYVPFLQYVFETVSLSFGELAFSIAVASSVFIADELLKFLKIQTGFQ